MHRSLNLVAQALSLGLPSAVALTMTDELEKLGGDLDLAALSQGLGVPVVGVVGNRKKGFAELRALVENPTSWPVPVVAPPAEPGPERESWTHSMLTLAHYVAPQENVTTSKVDKVLLHPVFGTLFFFLIMFLFFQVIFTVAAPSKGGLRTSRLVRGTRRRPHLQPAALQLRQHRPHWRRWWRPRVRAADSAALPPHQPHGKRGIHVPRRLLNGPRHG
ncbi:MAG: FeoB small GTPase domain-containing protein [Lawsonella clevelandensis]